MLISGGVFETRVPRKEAQDTKGEFRGFRALSWVSCSRIPADEELYQREIAACDEFARLSYSTGFQMGMLTPIISALRPDDFLLINNKSRRVVNYFASTTVLG
jgi:hypothetical protein